jgi:elongation of very long chain fatty acids protein 6
MAAEAAKTAYSFMDVEYWVGFDDWMANNYPLAFGICIGYLITIFGIQRLLRDREAFKLDGPLFVWNALLAAFSITAAYYVLPSMWSVIREKGVQYDLCTTDSEWLTPWVMFFCFSKVPELIDTLFVVLRKRPLRFLHYYHHVVTLLFCWDAWAVKAEYGGWFAAMNLVVHSIMYSYFAFAALKIRLPNALRPFITTLQILQMFGGLGVVIHNAIYCDTHRRNIYFGFAMYLSYVFLFCKFFVDSYLRSSADKKAAHAKAAAASKKSGGSADAPKARKTKQAE